MSNENNGKTVAILSYITIIGWLIAYFAMHKDKKTALGSYHLRQSLLLFLCAIAWNVVTMILGSFLPAIVNTILSLASLVFLVLWVIGLIAAINEQRKPIPLVGEKAQGMFPGI